jgi:hypothetical protein
MNPEDKKEYFKQYYINHKEKMDIQLKKSRSINMKRVLLDKLNNDGYKRIPYSKITKYEIQYDKENQIYS